MAKRSVTLRLDDMIEAAGRVQVVLGDLTLDALRRSELVGLDVTNLTWTTGGLKISVERSKTDADGEGAEIAIPQGRSEETCPVVALQSWLAATEITLRPLFRKANRGGKVKAARLTPDGVRQILPMRANHAGIKRRSRNRSVRTACRLVL